MSFDLLIRYRSWLVRAEMQCHEMDVQRATCNGASRWAGVSPINSYQLTMHYIPSQDTLHDSVLVYQVVSRRGVGHCVESTERRQNNVHLSPSATMDV